MVAANRNLSGYATRPLPDVGVAACRGTTPAWTCPSARGEQMGASTSCVGRTRPQDVALTADAALSGYEPCMTSAPQEPLDDPEIKPSLTPDGSPQPIDPDPGSPPDDPEGDPFEL